MPVCNYRFPVFAEFDRPGDIRCEFEEQPVTMDVPPVPEAQAVIRHKGFRSRYADSAGFIRYRAFLRQAVKQAECL